MNVTIKPGFARGKVKAPPSKSMAHRYLIAAALAKGESTVRGIEYSQDVLATIDCLRALGVEVQTAGDIVTVKGGLQAPKEPLLCRESGSTLRFFLPLCLLFGTPATLKGSDRLMERPLSIYETLSAEKGFSFTRKNGEITVCGSLQSGKYTVDGSVSSQFITGLLFALVPLKGKSVLHLTGKLESRSYIDLTLSALKAFGFDAAWSGEAELTVNGGTGTARDLTVEGDWSNAAFFDALTLLGGAVEVEGLSADSLQGDRVYRPYFEALAQGTPTLSLADCPDLGPILMAVAAACNGAELIHTARLKIKESDRGTAMAEELAKCGVKVTVEEDRILIPGGQLTAPTEAFFGHNDHRIVMSMAVLCTKIGGTVTGAEAVAKSLPDFFEKLSALTIEVIKDEVE